MTKPVNKRPTTAAAVVALTARAAPPDPRAGVTSATRCVSTPTCAARPSAKGADTLQKRQVRSASARERGGPAPDESATVERGSPSGPRPSVAGPRRMMAAARGSITAMRTGPAAASTAGVESHPRSLTPGAARRMVRAQGDELSFQYAKA